MIWKTTLLSTGESRFPYVWTTARRLWPGFIFTREPGGYLLAGGDLLGWLQEQNDLQVKD